LKINKGGWMKTKILIFILSSVILFVACESEVPQQSVDEPINWEAIEQLVTKLTNEGLIKKIGFRERKAWIDSAAWVLINAEAKETLTKTLAFYCGYKDKSFSYFIDIMDWQSGKKLAKYNSLGFKVY